MTQSIRRRLIWNLLGLSNEVSKRCMEYLSGHNVHSQARMNVDNGLVLEVYRGCSEGHVHGNSVNDPILCDEINKHYAGLAVANLPLNPAQFCGLSGSYNNFLGHQGSSQLNKMNEQVHLAYSKSQSRDGK